MRSVSKTKNKSIKKRSNKPICLKFVELGESEVRWGGHFCGRLYHTEDYELQRIRGGETQFFNKKGEPVKKKWEFFPPGKKPTENKPSISLLAQRSV